MGVVATCIDHCLINDSFYNDQLDFEVLDFEGSCHFPTCCSINPKIITPFIFKRRKVVWNHDKTIQFRETLKSGLTYHKNPSISLEELRHNTFQAVEICKRIATVTTTN
jgi:hypothetical protein